MAVLLTFVPKLAPKWEDIGYGLGLEDRVKVLRAETAFPSVTAKMSMLFESWLETVDGVSWHNLLKVLRDIGYRRIAAHMCEFLHDQGTCVYVSAVYILYVYMCGSHVFVSIVHMEYYHMYFLRGEIVLFVVWKKTTKYLLMKVSIAASFNFLLA